MPIVGKFFPSQKSQEKVFLLIRRHWFTYVGFLMMAIIISVPILVLIVASINNPELYSGPLGNILLLALSLYLLIALAVMLYGFIDYYLDVYILTNERIVSIAQNGFFKRNISELHLHQIQDVSAKVEGVFPTFIHYGDIFIQTAGERENFIFKSIPNPYRVSKLIVDLHEAQLEEKDRLASTAEIAEEYDEEMKGKMRDKIDLESIDPKSLSLAAKRSKEFLQGGPLEETDLRQQVKQELESQRYDNLLNKVKTSSSYEVPQEPAAPTPPPVEAKDEGEMKEDQEIDF